MLQELVRSKGPDEWQMGTRGGFLMDIYDGIYRKGPFFVLKTTFKSETGVDMRLHYDTRDGLVQELAFLIHAQA